MYSIRYPRVPGAVWRRDFRTPQTRKASAFFVALRQEYEHPTQSGPGAGSGRDYLQQTAPRTRLRSNRKPLIWGGFRKENGMSKAILTIASKNYGSWSLRGWL